MNSFSVVIIKTQEKQKEKVFQAVFFVTFFMSCAPQNHSISTDQMFFMQHWNISVKYVKTK